MLEQLPTLVKSVCGSMVMALVRGGLAGNGSRAGARTAAEVLKM